MDDEQTPATDAQKIYLDELTKQAGEPALSEDISKESANEEIQALEREGVGEEMPDIANDSDTTERFNNP